MKSSLCILLSIGFLTLKAQSILRDTSLTYSYGNFCPDLIVNEYMVSDSVLKKYNNHEITFDDLRINSERFFYRLAYNPADYADLVSFKDFKFCINEKCFTFQTINPTFPINRNYLIKHLDDIFLVRKVTNIKVDLDTITIISMDEHETVKENTILSLESDRIRFIELISNSTLISIQVPSLDFSLSGTEECGSTTFTFTKQNFRLIGKMND